MITLIGLSGAFESGKDTVASILAEQYGYTRVSIGNYVRSEILAYTPSQFEIPTISTKILEVLKSLNHKQVYAKPTSGPVRLALQWYGFYRYRQDPKYWLSKVQAEIEQLSATHVVLTDVRMPVEFYYVKEQGGQNWRIVRAARPIDPAGHHQAFMTGADHITENAISKYGFDQYLGNNSDVPALRHLVSTLVEAYGLRSNQQGLFDNA